MMADDCEEERHLHHHHLQRNKQQTAVAVATTQQHLFVGGGGGVGNDNGSSGSGPVAPFQFIVHEQAKSMVAIQVTFHILSTLSNSSSVPGSPFCLLNHAFILGRKQVDVVVVVVTVE